MKIVANTFNYCCGRQAGTKLLEKIFFTFISIVRKGRDHFGEIMSMKLKPALYVLRLSKTRNVPEHIKPQRVSQVDIIL